MQAADACRAAADGSVLLGHRLRVAPLADGHDDAGRLKAKKASKAEAPTTEARDAIDLVRDVADIRAVLSDIVMPGQVNGLALVEELRRIRPGLPLALMTGYREGPAEEATRPACPVLPKPFTSNMPAKTMSEILAP